MTDPDVGMEEARKAAQREAVKANVQRHVNAEISAQAIDSGVAKEERVSEVAAQLRETAIDDTVKGERAVARARVASRGSQFLDYAFYVLYALLAIRLLLALIAARSTNGFVQFIHTVTGPFYAPFRGIVDSPTTEAGNTLAWPIVIALVVYALLHAAINGLLRMAASRKTSI